MFKAILDQTEERLDGPTATIEASDIRGIAV
jgi:hypothetical protein